MNKKKQLEQLELAANVNKTFSVFEFLLEDKEKANFKDLVRKAESSYKVQDSQELYQTIQHLLLRTNFWQHNELHDKLYQKEDDFYDYSYQIDNALARYADKHNNHLGDADKAKVFAIAMDNLKNKKQEYQQAYATFQKAQLVHDKMHSSDWQKKYYPWAMKESAAIHDAADRLDVRFKTIFNDQDFMENGMMVLVASMAGIPLAVLMVLLGLASYVIEAPLVLAAKLTDRAEKKALPNVNNLLKQITKIMPPKSGSEHMGIPPQRLSQYHEWRDRFGVHYELEPQDFEQEHLQVLQRMDSKINTLEQLCTATFNQFTNEVTNKKAKLNMSNNVSHLIEKPTTFYANDSLDFLARPDIDARQK